MTALALVAFCAVALNAGPGGADMPAAEVWVHEDWPAESLAAVAGKPGVALAVATRSNMIRPEVVALLKRQPAALVEVRAPLTAAHVDQLRALPRAVVVVDVPEQPAAELARTLMHLGPQTLRFRVARLDEARARWLKAFKNAEVELDLRGRVPDQEEIALLRGLARSRRTVRLGPDAQPALVAALRAASLARVVVDAAAPAALVAALAELGVPVRAVVGDAASDLRSLGALGGLAFEFPLSETPATALARLERTRVQYAAPGP